MKKLLKRAARFLGYEIRAIVPSPPEEFAFQPTSFEYELLRDFATRAAGFAATPAQTQAVRQLYLTGILAPALPPEGSRLPIGSANTADLGIWKRESAAANAPFVRRADCRDEWFFWAQKDRIEPKQAKWRVVLLGESVARGYFYDPQFNVAGALETILSSEMGPTEIDVVDLAKSNLTREELRVFMGLSLALQPDILVVFAGNNWRPQLAEADIPYVDTLLRREGLPAVKSFLDTRTRQSVSLLARQVNAFLERQRTLSVIWVVPEFNLADWTDPISVPAHLPGQGDRRWRELDERIRLALREHQLVMAEELAKEMAELDGGTSSVPLRILAEQRRSAGDIAGARRYLELSRDAEGWDPSFSYSPRVSSSIQSALREASSAARNTVVDLPKVLEQHLDQALPDRRVFLDYCHLTAEGIRVSAAAIASEVLMALTARKVPPSALQAKCPSPAAKVEGKASFLAAVHNAHYYQSYDVVHYWCARAVQLWPESAELMTRFIDSQTRRSPQLACRSLMELFELDELGTSQYLLRGGAKRLDMVLGDAIANTLQETGSLEVADIPALRTREHSLKTGSKELTAFYYSSAIPTISKRAWMTCSLPNNGGARSLFASAYWETSKFIFFGERGRAAGLKLTYRLPAPSRVGVIEIAVNNQLITRAPVDDHWQTISVSIMADCVADGINEIVITWPGETGCSDEVLERMADELVARRLPRFHRVFGEIHSVLVFDATDCR